MAFTTTEACSVLREERRGGGKSAIWMQKQRVGWKTREVEIKGVEERKEITLALRGRCLTVGVARIGEGKWNQDISSLPGSIA